MAFDQQIARGVDPEEVKTEEPTTEVSGSFDLLISTGSLSVARPGIERSVLSASDSAFQGAFMFVLCFMMPVMALYTLPLASLVLSVGVSTSPANFLMSLSFLVVKVPVFRFLRR